MPHEIPSALTPKEYAELYPRYLASERSRKKSEHTITTYELALRKFRDYLNEADPDTISPLDVSEWTDSLLDSGVSTNTAHQYYGIVSMFFDWAIQMKLLKESPMPEDGQPEKEFKKKKIPSKDEIMRLLDPANIPFSIKGKLPLRNYTIVATLLLTGLRSDELRSLRLSDLDFENKTITVRNGKGGKERKAPFSPRTQEIIRTYLAAGIRPEWATPEDWLFGTHQHAMNQETASRDEQWHKFDAATLGRLVKRYGKTVIGKEIHPHLLRHCATSLWADSDINMRSIQLALGHANLTTTERIYADILDDKKAAQNIASILSTLSL